jgi:hypothetical protein
LAELLEQDVSHSVPARTRAQQAADDVHSWTATLATEARTASSSSRSGLETISKILVALAGVLGAIIAFGSAFPGALRQ